MAAFAILDENLISGQDNLTSVIDQNGKFHPYLGLIGQMKKTRRLYKLFYIYANYFEDVITFRGILMPIT